MGYRELKNQLQTRKKEYPIRFFLRNMYLEIYCLVINNRLMRCVKRKFKVFKVS